jgi:FAD dependent oxidoreductase
MPWAVGVGRATRPSRRASATASPTMELLKGVLLEMVLEAGVELLLHTWVVAAVIEDDCVKGLIVESKSGRQALLGQVTVDASGDGDVAALAGAEFKYRPYDPQNPDERIHNSVMFAMVLKEELQAKTDGDVTLEATGAGVQAIIKDYEAKNPDRFAELKRELEAQGGSMNIRFPGMCLQGDPLDAWDLTRMEIAIQHKMMVSLAFLRRNIPGLESLGVKRISPQFGQREGRRPVGLYELTGEDLREGRKFDDGICCKDCKEGRDRAHIPYRSLVPVKTDGLIFGTRALSATPEALGRIRLIGTSMGIGHAAGAAAGLCVREGVEPRQLSPELLRETLKQQKALC